jgi:hypothetical protein
VFIIVERFQQNNHLIPEVHVNVLHHLLNVVLVVLLHLVHHPLVLEVDLIIHLHHLVHVDIIHPIFHYHLISSIIRVQNQVDIDKVHHHHHLAMFDDVVEVDPSQHHQ